MAEADSSQPARDYRPDVPQRSEPFFLKGSNELDWGLKNRLASIFDPRSGRTVMLAFDHGYFQGPTTGLERVDLDVVPLTRWADTVMCTRGILRSTIPPTFRGGVVLRASGGPARSDRHGAEARAVADRRRLGCWAESCGIRFSGLRGLGPS